MTRTKVGFAGFVWALLAVACGGASSTVEGTGAGASSGSPLGQGKGQVESCNGVDDNGDGRIDETGCTEPTEQFGGHGYMFVNQAKSWEQAKAYCASKGYHLVTIESAEENAFLDQTTNSKAAWNISWWTGLNDRIGDKSFLWDDGTPLGYTNWDANEPD